MAKGITADEVIAGHEIIICRLTRSLADEVEKVKRLESITDVLNKHLGVLQAYNATCNARIAELERELVSLRPETEPGITVKHGDAVIRYDRRRDRWDLFYGPGSSDRSFPSLEAALAWVIREERNEVSE